jgi:hypothetical protein
LLWTKRGEKFRSLWNEKMIELISVVLLIVGALLMLLGALKFILNREQEKATVVLLEFLLNNHKPSKD